MPGDCSVGNPPVNNQLLADDYMPLGVFEILILTRIGSGN